jgi:hypothetical protein
MSAEAGTAGSRESQGGGHDRRTRQFGTGRKARVAAMRTADELRERGVAAAAIFKPSMGGWIVQIYPGGIRRRPGPADRVITRA